MDVEGSAVTCSEVISENCLEGAEDNHENVRLACIFADIHWRDLPYSLSYLARCSCADILVTSYRKSLA
jgi:hypothetical protein